MLIARYKDISKIVLSPRKKYFPMTFATIFLLRFWKVGRKYLRVFLKGRLENTKERRENMKNFGLKTNKLHRIIAATICVVMLLGLVFQVTLFSAPEGEEPKPEQAVTRVADASTINSWQEYYKEETDTSNVGKIWTDKTVSAGELELAESDLDMAPKQDNFMVGLSALSSSKSVVLEAAIPVDVMLVLDISASMADRNNKDKIEMLVKAVNDTIKEILHMNKDNRVGVVLYSGAIDYDEDSKIDTASCPLPLGQYTSETGNYFVLESSVGGSKIAVGPDVKTLDGIEMNPNDEWHIVTGNTYIQNGLLAAFEALSPETLPKGKIEGRIPVITLMSDGAPTAANVNYIERGDSTIGYGNKTDIRMAFLTQLTAAWIKESVKDYYVKSPLFYTVGALTELEDDEKTYAKMVLNPAYSNPDLDRWWEEFLGVDEGTTLHLSTNDLSMDIVKKESKLQHKSESEVRYYVDEFFNVSSAEDLIAKFAELVEKIKIQSAELPTETESPIEDEKSNSNYSGYLTFEDPLGRYMELEDMTGVMYGGEMHEGETFARKFAKDALEEERATEKEMEEFLNSLIERLNIDKTEAKKLLANAQDQKQISYNASNQELSNYIAWYAKEDGSYLEPYSGKPSESEEAAFLNKSYFYYGKSSGTLEGEKLMYLGVRVEETLEKNEKERMQKVRFSVPASLIPLVQYQVSRNATNVEDSHVNKMEAYPVHLFYEIGLKDGISEYDLSGVDSNYKYLEDNHESKKIATFYPSVWLDNEEIAEAEATVDFTASTQNEYYYYTEETPIYTKTEEEKYELYKGEMPTANDGKEYYYKKRVYGLSSRMVEMFLPIDRASLNVEKATDGKEGWVILPETFRYEKLEQKNKNNTDITETSDYIYKTTIKTDSATYNSTTEKNSISVFLGNNGKLSLKQGKISISKEVTNFFNGHNDETAFDFEINLKPKTGEKIPSSIKGIKNGKEETCTIRSEKIEFKLVNNATIEFWLPSGKNVSVDEVGENASHYATTMTVTQRNQETETISGPQVSNVEISTYAVASVKAGNSFNPPWEEINLYKVDSTSKKPLGGAKFEIYRLECENTQHTNEVHEQFLEVEEEEHECWVWAGEAESDNDYGYLDFRDSEDKPVIFIKNNIYRLIEVTAPKGYMKPAGQWNMMVDFGGNEEVVFKEVLGKNGEKPPAIKAGEKRYSILNVKPIAPPITGGRGIDRFLILGATVAVSGLMITVHLVLQRKRGKL